MTEAVREAVMGEVSDWWNDDSAAAAKFKNFSGQRSDWESSYLSWRKTILNVARRLNLIAINPSEVKNVWFSRGGLTPLCIDRVLHEMHASGDILLRSDLVDPTSGRLYRMLRKVGRTIGMSKSLDIERISDNQIILTNLLEERCDEVIKSLSESHWTSTCIATLEKFQSLCTGPEEAFIILSHLSELGKGQYLSIRKQDIIEGVKVSLIPASLSVSSITNLDYDTLHLNWTSEKLQKQLDAIDQRFNSSKKKALAYFKSGNKLAALRCIRQSKVFMDSRYKCGALLDRVEEVLNQIMHAESVKKVSEAVQIGARAIKESKINVDELKIHLQELDGSVFSQMEVNDALESMPLAHEIEDEDIEDEFKKLEMELAEETPSDEKPKNQNQESDNTTTKNPADSLSESLSNLNLDPA